MNHDELFKSLLKTGRLLRDFFEAFFPKLCRFIDFGHIEFVDKERFTHKGERRTGDLLIKTRFRGEDAAFLIHLEHEGQAHRDLARRMLEYFILDWRDYGLPVYPIAVLSHRKLDPGSMRPLRMTIRGDKILDFRFAVIDLARLDARKYAGKLNAAAMALSTRMQMDPADRVGFTVDLIRNTVSAGWQQGELDTVLRFFLAYQQFTPKEDLKLQRELARIEGMEIPKEVLQRNPLVRFGMNKGRQQGELELVLRLLTRRLGRISAPEDKAVRRLSLSGIEALGEALLDFRTGTDLSRWLKFHTK